MVTYNLYYYIKPRQILRKNKVNLNGLLYTYNENIIEKIYTFETST